MKSLSEQMHNYDREQMRRVAHNLPEQYDDQPSIEHVAQIINGVFTQLVAVKGKSSIVWQRKSGARRYSKPASDAPAMASLQYHQRLHTRLLSGACQICMSGHGLATGSHFLSRWWGLVSRKRLKLKKNFSMQPAFTMKRAKFSILTT